VLIAAACHALGDQESATMEADAARWLFYRLGAAFALARLDDDAKSPACRRAKPTKCERPHDIRHLTKKPSRWAGATIRLVSIQKRAFMREWSVGTGLVTR
jgi:hypothetical protein